MQEEMKHQLRRMVLVNAGTNMHVPSGRITAVDPRGGAAVLGDNGVGKTTTLRILPLFFGHLPSQIVSSGQGQEPMIRFVLPTDGSAIAFEYQRGSDSEEDLRLAVIRRRRDDHDAPFYRLYRCGFRKELFVAGGRFLDDDETQQTANELGIKTTGKLTTAEYRCVILRTPATSKDKERLRHHALDWSFGPKGLDNLDRLVAAMVKKHINFADIVQVAVGLVQQDLGHGSERAKLTYKQGKAQIERWLRDRQACAEAFALAPKVTELEELLKQHRTAEATFRARRADVAALTGARQLEKSQVARAIETMSASHESQLAAEKVQREELGQAAAQAAAAAATLKQEYDELAAQAEYFEAHGAAKWELRVQELPVLRSRKQQLQAQVDAAEAMHAEANWKYARMQQEATTRAGVRRLELEQAKHPHNDRYTSTLERITAAENQARREAEALNGQQRQQLERALEPLLQESGLWQERQKSPAASEEAVQELEKARDRLDEHAQKRNDDGAALSAARQAEHTARDEFNSAEKAVRDAKRLLEQAKADVESAQLILTPNPASLLAALRRHPDEAWKTNLAKVLDRSLLEREDLDAQAVEEASQTLYGWQVNTGAIAAPDWSDDARAREALETVQGRQASAEGHLAAAQAALEGKSKALKAVEKDAGLAQARVDMLAGQTEELKTVMQTAKAKVETERRSAAAVAAAEFRRLKSAIEEVKHQQQQVAGQLKVELAGIKQAHDKQRDEAKGLRDDAIAAIDKTLGAVDEELRNTLGCIATQLEEHLSAQGVDVVKLNKLKDDAVAVTQEVLEREEKEPMVQRWRNWIAAGGPIQAESKRKAAQTAQEHSHQQAANLAEFDASAAKSARDFDAALGAKTKRASDVEDELEVLASLDSEFGDYMAVGASVVDSNMTARELRGKVHDDRDRLENAHGLVVKRFHNLRQALTVKDNAVRELVDVSLDALGSASEIARASELCTCYKLIGPQIANDVNLTLKTVLTNISAFQKAIQSFESEVSAFNRRLQAGLSEVRCFERIKDLRLDIITNFDNLGFYKKLSRMDEVVRRHAKEVGKDFSRELPPDETARALGDFVSVLGTDGTVEVNLSSHITLNGSVTDNGQRKEFRRASELENISSEGLTSLVLITLMTALLNTIRRADPVHVPWVTDEVGKFDPKNFHALMTMLQDNRIDVVTASPELGSVQQELFARRYLFEDRGVIRECRPKGRLQAAAAVSAAEEAVS